MHTGAGDAFEQQLCDSVQQRLRTSDKRQAGSCVAAAAGSASFGRKGAVLRAEIQNPYQLVREIVVELQNNTGMDAK